MEEFQLLISYDGGRFWRVITLTSKEENLCFMVVLLFFLNSPVQVACIGIRIGLYSTKSLPLSAKPRNPR